MKTTTTQRESAARDTAPEYIFGMVVSDNMDVYSMGLMAYEAIGGTHPICPKPVPLATICELQRDAMVLTVVRKGKRIQVPVVRGAARVRMIV